MADSDGNSARHQTPTAMGDSSCSPRSVHSSNPQGVSPHERRLRLLRSLGCLIPEFPVQQFLGLFLPPLKSGICVDSILTSIKCGKHIRNGRWAPFPEDSERFDGREREAFQCLEDIFDEVIELAMRNKHDPKQALRLRLLPDTARRSEGSSNILPDGFLVLKEAEGRMESGRLKWYDLAGTCEFKMKDDQDTRHDVGP